LPSSMLLLTLPGTLSARSRAPVPVGGANIWLVGVEYSEYRTTPLAMSLAATGGPQLFLDRPLPLSDSTGVEALSSRTLARTSLEELASLLGLLSTMPAVVGEDVGLSSRDWREALRLPRLSGGALPAATELPPRSMSKATADLLLCAVRRASLFASMAALICREEKG